MQQKFWTIMDGDKFLNSNFMRDSSDSITEAVRFRTEDGCKEFFEGLRQDRGFKIAEVTCEVNIIT